MMMMMMMIYIKIRNTLWSRFLHFVFLVKFAAIIINSSLKVGLCCHRAVIYLMAKQTIIWKYNDTFDLSLSLAYISISITIMFHLLTIFK